jgi:hypothetical protein
MRIAARSSDDRDGDPAIGWLRAIEESDDKSTGLRVGGGELNARSDAPVNPADGKSTSSVDRPDPDHLVTVNETSLLTHARRIGM